MSDTFGAWIVGPIILGLEAPAYVLQRHATSDEIFNIITVAVAQSEFLRRDAKSKRKVLKPSLKVVNV